ncbi:SpvB/TcaC N-terminal domain-containing protein [Stackebrandtia nassauensis]|uniref:SpvB/TcaC N-terminal domain-containing protein n=1 Tax=Stackebrandtia nassauensis TaxID=283811 RepID=UPI0001A3A3BA|nr:SpvB/TcaC N-terminal domain-containing protein [Stackebrandtia nassauensis]
MPKAPAISAPTGGGAIRGIGEKFAANPVTGTATTTVPIATSPGRSGFAPSLTLGYDSGAGNGPFGLGWQLPIPTITRKTDRGLPRYRADAPDTFILSGSEDLVPHADGPSQRELDGRGYTVRRYLPRIEGTFARIEQWHDDADGTSHWQVISRDNVTSRYGRTPHSRIADPDDPSRIYSWLLCDSFDPVGNAIHYEYKSEDAAGVDLDSPHEANRSAAARHTQRYLKRIRYGNTVSRLLDPDLTETSWLFEVVFDYGEHDAEVPTPAEAHPWRCRPDPFSHYRAGFEIRGYRLCQRILMFHHFPDAPGVGADCLVRSTDLEYRHDPVGSFVERLHQRGYRRDGDGYRAGSLPPLDFSYSRPVIDDTPRLLPEDSLRNLPIGVDGPGYQWVDLDGEGLPGILSWHGDSLFYKPNLGNGRFGPVRGLASQPSTGLAKDKQQLLDLAGDGQVELVDFGGPTPGFYERDTATAPGWRNFRAFASLPNLDPSNPNLRFVDLTGDGLADVLITEDEVFTWHESLGENGFASARRHHSGADERVGPSLVFDDGTDSIHLADMSGGGLSDLVRIRNGEVCYWPSLGYGRFGARVTMDDSPWFDEPEFFDQKRLRLADIDGTGATDLIYLHRDETRIYRNRSGNGWEAPQGLATSFPQPQHTAQVTVADLLGTGTACLVWSSPLPADQGRQVWYIDLLAQGKPHLLTGMVNNLGSETYIHYAPSTKFYLDDNQAGRPWITRLPFPVHVVERVETVDRVSHHRFVSRYAYHHGYFDGAEREFRGFAMVEQWDTEAFAALSGPDADITNADEYGYVPATRTKTWFHTGSFEEAGRISRQLAGEYYGRDEQLLLPDTVLPEQELTDEELRQAHRALKGLTLRQELYAEDGNAEADRPYQVSEQNYTLHMRQTAARGQYAVFTVNPRETITAHYERECDEPRVAHEIVLATDDFDNILTAVSIAYGRRQADPELTEDDAWRQRHSQLALTVNQYTNAVAGPHDYRAPLLWQRRVYELLGLVSLPGNRFAFDTLAAAVDGGSSRRMIAQSRTRYRRDDLSGPLPWGELESLALPLDDYRKAFTPGLLSELYGDRVDAQLLTDNRYLRLDEDDGWWLGNGRVRYSPAGQDEPAQELAAARAHFFLPRRFADPFGAETLVDYDPADLEPTTIVDAVGNSTTAEYDFRVLEPILVTDPNGNRTATVHDALGLVTGTALMGKQGEQLGDLLDGFDPDLPPERVAAYLADPLADPHALLGNATTRLVYDQFAYLRTQQLPQPQPAVAATLARETHASALAEGEVTRLQLSFTYTDGFQREIQRKVQAEPGSDGAPRWAGTGWTVFNNKGMPIREYEPFFATTHAFEFARAVGVGTVMFYDPLGRKVAVLHPDGSWEKVDFDPWRQTTWDVNDTVLLDPRTDPHVGGYLTPYLDTLPDWRTWYRRRSEGDLGPTEQAAASAAAVHSGTPARIWLDSSGRPFLTELHNRFERDGAVEEERYRTRSLLDFQGNEREVVDALGRTTMRYSYDLMDNRVGQQSMEAGDRLAFNDATGKPVRMWNSRGARFRFEYDELRRLVRVHVRDREDGPESLQERLEYGEDQPDPAERNLRDRVFRHFDAAGIATSDAYDFKGNLLSATRQLTDQYRGDPDWSADVPLSEPLYTNATQFDALNRPTAMTAPDHSVISLEYNEANLPDSMSARLSGGQTVTPLVTGIDYDARGHRTSIRYGNGSRTEYTYDPENFRLRRLRTTRGDTALQDLRYTYDPSGNITHIADEAQQAVFFRNQRVSASSDYRYDAMYRLIEATGREHLGQNGKPSDPHDTSRSRLAHPNDGQAMGRYRQRYRYDAVGNLLSMAHNGSGSADWTRRYVYLEPSLLQPERSSNRLSGTTDASDAPLHRFGYDGHGNITGMPELPFMDWDASDRLSAVSRQPDPAPDTAELTYYRYDATGGRVRKVTRRGGRTVAERIYIGVFEVYREFGDDGQRTLERQTLHLLDGDQRVALAETRTEGTDDAPERLLRFPLANHLNSATLELDDAARIISYEEYYPYGGTSFQSVRSQAETPKRYRFSGKERDTETGFYYFGARYYAPWLARWISCDPQIADFAAITGSADESQTDADPSPPVTGGAVSLYEAMGGNPVVMTDPDGRQITAYERYLDKQFSTVEGAESFFKAWGIGNTLPAQAPKTSGSATSAAPAKPTDTRYRIELLIGGPYKKDGKDHPYGHAAVRVVTPDADTTYDFGRYGKTWGTGGSEGEGMLNVWTNFAAYIASENSYGRETTGFSFVVTPEQAAAVTSFFSALTKGLKPKLTEKNMTRFRLSSDYHALTCNCTTISLDALEKAFPGFQSKASSFNTGRGLDGTDKLAVNFAGWPKHLFMPADAKAYLQSTEFSALLAQWGLADPTVNSYKTGKELPATALPPAKAPATSTAKPPSTPPKTPRKQPQSPSRPSQGPSKPLRIPKWLRKLAR